MKPKILPLEFHDYTVLPKSPGLKFVLFRIEDKGKLIGFDYGFANFENGIFEQVADGQSVITTKVIKWCTLPDPKLLF